MWRNNMNLKKRETKLPETGFSMSAAEILEAIATAKTETKILKQENDLLSSFANEIEVDLDSIQVIHEHDSSVESSSDSSGSDEEDKNDGLPTLSAALKCYIASQRVEKLESELTALQRSRVVEIDAAEAKVEQIEEQQRQTEEEIKEFNQNIRVGAKHPITKKIMGEKVLKYLQNRLRNDGIAVERWNLEMLEHRAKKKKLLDKMNEEIEANKLLKDIDVLSTRQKLVASQALLDKYDAEYYEHRVRFNCLLREVDDKKKAVSKASAELEVLLAQLRMKEKSRAVFESEKAIIEKERLECEALKKKILLNPRCRGMPSVLEYAQLQVAYEEKLNEVKWWQKKIYSAELVKYCSQKK